MVFLSYKQIYEYTDICENKNNIIAILIEGLLCARPCFPFFTCVNSIEGSQTPVSGSYCYNHFADWQTEAREVK